MARKNAGTRARSTRRPPRRRKPESVAPGIEVHEVESLRAELERLRASAAPPRWNADPDDVRRSVAKLVLTLVEAIRQLLERQAIRRMEAKTLTEAETEAVGLALMKLEETIREIGAQFGLDPQDLNLDLGPVGKLV
ncbi:MAG TPA: gas vesicle protein K [Vicinamibacterales bacterium]|nr:gas vesicle protein K [Vicinamibacterales bacterium]